MHRFLSIAAVVFASLLSTGNAVLGDPGVADPGSQPPGLFIEGDLVSGVLGPSLCVLQNRFSPGDHGGSDGALRRWEHPAVVLQPAAAAATSGLWRGR